MPAKASRALRSGRRVPAGGIMPARTLRTTFSQVSASAATWSRSQFVECQAAGFQFLVVAGDAVLVE